MMAMIKLWKSPLLKQLRWKLLLQIHDEVILEGPIETKDAAMKEVRDCMENPFDGHGLTSLRGTIRSNHTYVFIVAELIR
jgi:DNA polymerase-1